MGPEVPRQSWQESSGMESGEPAFSGNWVWAGGLSEGDDAQGQKPLGGWSHSMEVAARWTQINLGFCLSLAI